MAQPRVYPRYLDVGTGPFARRYRRRPGEFVLHFPDAVPEGVIDSLLSDLTDLGERVEHHSQRHEGLRAAGMRWMTFNRPDREMRAFARSIEASAVIVDAVTPVFQPAAGDEGEAAVPFPRDLMLRIDPADFPSARERLADLGLERVDRASDHLNGDWSLFRLVTPLQSDDGFEKVRSARSVPGVLEAEHDWIKIETYHQVFPDGPPADEFWPGQRGLQKINMEEAWAAMGGAPGVPVAVADSGFDLGHPDIDYEAPDKERYLNVPAIWRGDENDFDAGPSRSPHGTPVASILGAKIDSRDAAGNTGVGIASIGGDAYPGPVTGLPNGNVVPLKLGAKPSASRVALALAWAREKDIRVVSLSLTTVATSVLIPEIEACWAANLVLCAATGNGFGNERPSVGFPARHPYVIGVGAGAGDDYDRRKTPDTPDLEWWWSRYGSGVDVIAPGVDLWAADERAAAGGSGGWNTADGGAVLQQSWFGSPVKEVGDASGDYLAVFGGTSGATPHVAGLAALLLAQDPARTNLQVRTIIERTSHIDTAFYTDLMPHPDRVFGPGDPDIEWTPEVGCGLIDAGAAVTRADEILDDPVPGVVTPSGPGGWLEADPCDLPEYVTVSGYLGEGAADGTWRIYETTDLSSWLEVRADDILATGPGPGEPETTECWIRHGAEIRRVVAETVTATLRR